MKELSIEEKARAYDKVLKEVKDFFEGRTKMYSDITQALEFLFPELKESKDEKIRKQILSFLKEFEGDHYRNLDFSSWITWLEKQKHVDAKPHIPDGSSAYDKGYEEAQKYLSERGFDIPWNDGDVFVDERYITQTVANVLAWGDEHPKQNLEKQGASKTTKGIFEVWKDMRCEIYAQASGNRHEPNCSDNTTKLFSLNDIDELIEKLGEQKPTDKTAPKFKVGDWVVQEEVGIYKVREVCESWYEVVDDKDNYYSIGFDKEYMCHLWSIQYAKNGDILTWDDSGCITLFNYIHADGKSFDSHGFVGHCTGIFHAERTSYHDVIGAHPATKEQRDTLFEKMKEAGYEWNANKRELTKIEQKPTDKVEPKFKQGDSIVQGCNILKKIEQELTDKIKLKFNPGDWVVHNNVNVYQVKIIDYTGIIPHYELENIDGDKLSVPFTSDYDLRNWTIEDAKDGDVLYINNTLSKSIMIYKSFNNGVINKYASYNKFGFEGENYLTLNDGYIIPATKEQYDLLFQKMKEAGYEWNVEKKELIKIDQKLTDNIESKFKVGDKIVYRGNLYKIIDVTRTPYNRFIYDVDIMNILTDPEDVVTSIGPAGEDQMLRYND